MESGNVLIQTALGIDDTFEFGYVVFIIRSRCYRLYIADVALFSFADAPFSYFFITYGKSKSCNDYGQNKTAVFVDELFEFFVSYLFIDLVKKSFSASRLKYGLLPFSDFLSPAPPRLISFAITQSFS